MKLIECCFLSFLLNELHFQPTEEIIQVLYFNLDEERFLYINICLVYSESAASFPRANSTKYKNDFSITSGLIVQKKWKAENTLLANVLYHPSQQPMDDSKIIVKVGSTTE